ncbi:MAG: thiol oxidoreductase, partial [Bryobacterales bacterium]|nr:thiol oxidoreductase [Bryobacterales bacterium]
MRVFGPTLQVRREPGGEVIPLFTIAGRIDAEGCMLPQFDFESEHRRGRLRFRIPTPLYGMGLLEAIPDTEIIANLYRNLAEKKLFGIRGTANTGPPGVVRRFGWKAQERSLEVFAADAYLTEQGVTSELFPAKLHSPPSACVFNPLPEDRKQIASASGIEAQSTIGKLSQYLRYLTPPVPVAESPVVVQGKRIFESIGCNLCHVHILRTGNTSAAALRNREVALYSDLLLHDMGVGLADGIAQGSASGRMFRTAPLWG